MNTLKLLNLGSNKLKNQNISSHILDSEILLSKVLEKKREEILLNLDLEIDDLEVKKFESLIQRRSFREPIAYILNRKEFWSKSFYVNRETLIPRPETEIIVEKLIKIYKNRSINLLDIGTGSGCILISLLSELQNSKGVGIDISKKALQLAKKNAIKHKIYKRTKFIRGSFTNLYNKKFDLIVSNPPYVESREIKNLDEDIKRYEPKIAIDGGNDGLDVIKKVIYKAKEILKVNGKLAIEIGENQSSKVSKILKKNKFIIKNYIKDNKENIRFLISVYQNWIKNEQ